MIAFAKENKGAVSQDLIHHLTDRLAASDADIIPSLAMTRYISAFFKYFLDIF